MIVVHLPFTADRTSGHHDSLDDTKTYRIIAKNKGEVLSLFLMIERTSTDSSGEHDYTVYFTILYLLEQCRYCTTFLVSDSFPVAFSVCQKTFENSHGKVHRRGGSRGEGAGGAHPPRDDLRFSNTTDILRKKKTMCFIGVEVEQQWSAPPPKKNPGSAPDKYLKLFDKTNLLHLVSNFKP